MSRFAAVAATLVYWCIAYVVAALYRIDDPYSWASATPERIAAGNNRALIVILIALATYAALVVLMKRRDER